MTTTTLRATVPARTTPGARDLRVGIDVGGTNTDAVVLTADGTVIARTKQATSADVTTGLRSALTAVLDAVGEDAGRVGRVMLGTTHATNAILERRGLGRVAAVRLGGPATTSVPPLQSWPGDLASAIAAGSAVLPGGHYVDGRPISGLDEDRLRAFLDTVAGRVDAVALTGVFSPAFTDHELAAAELVRKHLGDGVQVSMSHEVGSLGLLERENATVLNAALYQVIATVRDGLHQTLAARDLDAATYFAQNDGTLMTMDYAADYPVLTIGSGPSNSIRGAACLSGLDDAIVADVGGTSTDFGALVAGFPRESAAGVEIGGVGTNFRMPDILALALGGGTVIGPDGQIGPESVGYRISREAFVFGGGTATLTDAGVLAGRGAGLSAGRIPGAAHARLRQALADADARLADAVDRITFGKADRPLVVVGGGAFLIPDDLPGVSEVVRPDHGDVANAVGAAIAMVSGTVETIIPAGQGRAEAIAAAEEAARHRAIQAGGAPSAVEVVEINEVPLSYLNEPALRLRVKAAGPLGDL
ncbi:hydantoinase/oxoprolinase family protein [Streptomyces sp. NBC_00873]|uniref:hydantoinase/oxoprolinase family protein n=1 Tax=unclassified Streptomyces TaxID=2593676 RepID=UPI002259C3EF|nr:MULTISPECIES: hydantoinase/oxoprolinase family protein [unclassified Streptomyces]MCX4538951.1 hydantoinase/oxoprolinase family protein [Streptomyces sp. NBC_01669]WSA04817.1 hydantoinase/oxoprolinase family protein [Streptomyces sp. NBC_00841]WSJ92312.1 hydantoinase/oxoprolinase family protein [Streptomyces sp. NBC_01320]WSY96087.1 hydantoinase/oxoprolinase family protein [Streptomyces sp. NBC_00873]